MYFLRSMVPKRAGQEDTIRVFRVVSERSTVSETEALIQSACRLESRHGSCFEAQASVRALAGLGHDVLQHRARHTFPSMSEGRAHGLDFAVPWTELFQRAAAKQLTFGPSRPEGDLRLAQRGDIERMHTLGRRELMHVLKMLRQECADFTTGEVIEANFHDRFSSGLRPQTNELLAGAAAVRNRNAAPVRCSDCSALGASLVGETRWKRRRRTGRKHPRLRRRP